MNIAVLMLALLTETAFSAQTEPQWIAQGKDLKAAGNASGALKAFEQAATLNPKSAALQDASWVPAGSA